MPGDIYIHTWDRINSRIGSWWNNWQVDLEGELNKISSQVIDLKKIISVYNPKHLIIETDPGTEHLELLYRLEAHKSHLALKNYLQGQAKIFNITKELQKKYDKYFFVRFDVNFPKKMSEEEFYADGFLVPVIPSGHGNLVFDVWKLGTFEECNVATNYVNEIDNWWYNRYPTFDPNMHIYELTLTEYYQKNDIKLVESSTPCELIRLSYNNFG
jgi:hypothetical protein